MAKKSPAKIKKEAAEIKRAAAARREVKAIIALAGVALVAFAFSN